MIRLSQKRELQPASPIQALLGRAATPTLTKLGWTCLECPTRRVRFNVAASHGVLKGGNAPPFKLHPVPHAIDRQQELPPLPHIRADSRVSSLSRLVLRLHFHPEIPPFRVVPSERSVVAIGAGEVFDRRWGGRGGGRARGGGRGGVAREADIFECEGRRDRPVAARGGRRGRRRRRDEMRESGKLSGSRKNAVC